MSAPERHTEGMYGLRIREHGKELVLEALCNGDKKWRRLCVCAPCELSVAQINKAMGYSPGYSSEEETTEFLKHAKEERDHWKRRAEVAEGHEQLLIKMVKMAQQALTVVEIK